MAGLVRGHVALAVDHAQRAVGAHHPVLHVIAGTAPQGRLAGRGGIGSIVRMDQAEPPPVPLRHVDGLHAEDAARLVRQGDAPRPVVALPPPDMRDALRRFEAALAVTQVADGQEAAQGIGQTPADLAEQALLVVGPAARLRALVQARTDRGGPLWDGAPWPCASGSRSDRPAAQATRARGRPKPARR